MSKKTKTINLNFGPQHPAAHGVLRLILELEIPIKIGFQSKISDKLYSLIIQKSDSGFFENNYHTIEKILGLSEN